MYRPDYMPDPFTRPINEITGTLPIYRPKQAGRAVLRVLPAFVPDAPGSDALREAPLADWERGAPSNSEGLGQHHFEPTLVTIWKDRGSHLLSAVARQSDTGKYVTSPAACAADRIVPMFEEGAEAIRHGIRVTEPFVGCDNWKRRWIGKGGKHLVQALLIEIDGKPKVDPRTNTNPKVAFELPWSAVKDMRLKLFSSAQPGRQDLRASESDNRLGDYASCAGGRLLAVMPNTADGKSYYVELLGACPLDPAKAMQLWTPWDEMYTPPSCEDAFATLRGLLSPAAFAYGLLGSPYELWLSDEEKREGRGFRVVQGTTVPGASLPPQPQEQAQMPHMGAPAAGLRLPPPPAQRVPHQAAPAQPSLQGGYQPQPPSTAAVVPPHLQEGSSSAVVPPHLQPLPPAASGDMPPFEAPDALEQFPDPMGAASPALRPPVSPMAPRPGAPQAPGLPSADELAAKTQNAQPAQPLALRL